MRELDTGKTILEEELARVLGENLLELEPEFGPDSDLFEAGLDSMAIMQLLLMIEEDFGASIPAGELTRQNLSTIRSLAALIREKRAQPS